MLNVSPTKNLEDQFLKIHILFEKKIFFFFLKKKKNAL